MRAVMSMQEKEVFGVYWTGDDYVNRVRFADNLTGKRQTLEEADNRPLYALLRAKRDKANLRGSEIGRHSTKYFPRG